MYIVINIYKFFDPFTEFINGKSCYWITPWWTQRKNTNCGTSSCKRTTKDFEQSQITIPMIAAQAGVTPSTIYRRWGDINQLFSDVALNELKPDMEPKDLGSFQQDITAWVEQYFEEYASEVGQDLLRDVLYTSNSDSNARKCETLIIQQLDIIQNRAKLRNELTIPNQVIIEAVIAPMLFRILFTNHDLSLEYVYDLLNRLFIKIK